MLFVPTENKFYTSIIYFLQKIFSKLKCPIGFKFLTDVGTVLRSDLYQIVWRSKQDRQHVK